VPLSEIYKRRPRRGWLYPYMVISPINATTELTNSVSYMDEPEFQFSTVSTDDIEAETLGEAAFYALLPKTENRLTFLGGYEMVRMPTYHGQVMEQSARGPGNNNTWVHTFGYRILVGK
jgi:hypothetical protein